MKFILYLNFVSICFHLTGTHMIYNISNQVALIKFIHKHYTTSSVFVIHAGSNNEKHLNDLVIQNIIFDWARSLYREQIVTACGTYEDIDNFTKHYEKFRPLIIVFVPGPQAFDIFANHTMNVKMSLFAWFVIFVPTAENEQHDYCHHPIGNALNLMLDTEMLVMCPDDTIIREWYSVDGKNTEIFDFLKLHPDGRSVKLEILTNSSIFERRSNLRGKVLKAVTVKNTMFITMKNGEMRGFFSNIIVDLQKILNFTIGSIIEEDVFGIYNATTSSWNGAFNLVASGQVDISLCPFSMTNVRLGIVDFTIPISTSTHYIYVKQPQVMSVKWFAYYRAFSFCLWMCVLMVIIISSFTSIFIRSHIESSSIRHLIIEESLRIWCIVCQQGIPDIPRCASLRVTYLTLLLTSLVMTSAYSASLVSFLTGSVHDVPFHTVDEFLNDGSYQIIVEKDTSDYDMFMLSTDKLSRRIQRMLRPYEELPTTVREAFQNICDDSKLGFYTSFTPQSTDYAIPCKVSPIDFGRVDSLCLILPKDSEYTTIMNFHLQKLINSGLVYQRKMGMNFEENAKFEPVGIFSAVSALIIFAGGAALALIVFIAELCYHTIRS